MLKKIITNTSESREAFVKAASEAGGGSNANEVVLSADEISALQQGACIALDDGEYTTFLTLTGAHEASPAG